MGEFFVALKDIIGQDKALRVLFGTLRRVRVPSATLLMGDSGVGKKLAAINYAKAINCLHPVDFDCCDKCTSCKKIDSKVHPDVLMIIPVNNEIKSDEIKIDEIRKAEEALSLKPFEGKKKVIIIDDAETMNIYAANAFLKTLEEPPLNSHILLISSNTDKLLSTIISRCMKIHFYPLSLDECKSVILKSIETDTNNTNLRESVKSEMDYILKIATGRPGLAISKDFAKEREWFIKLLGDMVNGKSKGTWADRIEIKLWLDMASVFLRDMVVFKVTKEESNLILSNSQWTKGSGQEIGDMLDAYQNLQAVRGLLNFNLNKSIVWNYVASIMQRLDVGV